MRKVLLQSVIISKDKFNETKAIQWIKKHFKYNGIDEKENVYRFRMLDPHRLYVLGYTDYFVRDLNNGIKLVMVRKPR